MELESESKRPELAEDRISALPDAILCHILSCLPQPEFTKCLVRTSILSKRWKDIWAYLSNLFFDGYWFSSCAEFIAFVDRALISRDLSAIRKCHLHINGPQDEELSRVQDWIRTVVRCKVVELDLSVDPHGEEMFELPESLLTCETLESWELCVNSLTGIPKAGCYPSVKSLHLKFMYPSLLKSDNDLMDFSQFPVLENLSIEGFLGFKSFTFIISVPELKTLKIKLFTENDVYVAHNFLIDAPKLERLDVCDDFWSNYTFVNARSLVEANVYADAPKAAKFLEGISTVKCLTISSHFAKACSMAAFGNLREFKVVLEMGYFNWRLLTTLLGRMLNLECLVMEHAGYDLSLYDGVVANPRWRLPVSVPNCLVSHLKTICIKGYKGKDFWGYPDEKEVIKYLLKNGKVLQKLTLLSPNIPRREKDDLVYELSRLQWGSRTCQVIIFTAHVVVSLFRLPNGTVINTQVGVVV